MLENLGSNGEIWFNKFKGTGLGHQIQEAYEKLNRLLLTYFEVSVSHTFFNF